MKTITVRHPWAWCLFHGKPVENRDYAWPWNTHRGPIWIHASKKCTSVEYRDAVDWIHHVIAPDFYVPTLEMLPLGMIVGSAELTGVVRQHDSPWFNGPFGLVLTNAKELLVPVPAKGKLGLWEWKHPL